MRRLSHGGVRRLPLLMLVGGLLAAGARAVPGSESAPSAGAQAEEPPSTRREQLIRQRQARLAEIEPYQLRGMEKTLLWLEQRGFDRLLNIHFKWIYPKFSNIINGSGFSPGVRFWKPRLGGTEWDLQASAAVSTRGYQLYDLQLGKLPEGGRALIAGPVQLESAPTLNPTPLRETGWFAYADLRYRDLPQLEFFGIGPDSKPEERSDFQLRDAAYELVAGYRFERVTMGVRTGFLELEVRPGTDRELPDLPELFEAEEVPGLEDQPDFLHISSGVLFDLRDNPRNPHQGALFSLTYSRYDDREVGEFQFDRLRAEALFFQPLGSIQRVLAVRFLTSLDSADEGARVPFYLQQTLGGSDTLRGFRDYRFRDEKLLYLSAEYRWEAAPALEFALFYDAGKVFSDMSEFDLKGLRKSLGWGARFKTPDGVFLRFDVGRSRENTMLHLKFGASF